MKKNKLIILIIAIIIILVIIMFMRIVTKDSSKTGINNSNATNQQTLIKNNVKVEVSEFIANLKAYFVGEKLTSVKLGRNNNGTTTEYNIITNGLDVQQSDVEIANNKIKVNVADNMVYEWNYQIDNDSATFTIQKDNPTTYDKIVLSGNVNTLSTIFVAYIELLGIEPKEALAFWELAVRDINKEELNDGRVAINNEIFSTIEENRENSYSFILKINNKQISNLNELLEIEKGKQSTTMFVSY